VEIYVYALLVEGGKTKTLSMVISDRGDLLSYSISGSSGWTTIGFDNAFLNLKSSIMSAINKCRLSPREIDIAILGLPDLDTENAKAYFEEKMREWGVFRVKPLIIPDFVVAYYAVTLGEPGIAVIAGTGSIAYGRNSKGISARAGGWGWFGNDEGSAIWIAMKAIEASGKFFDGRGPYTIIAQKILNFFKIKDPLHLIDIVYPLITRNVGELGKLAILVDEAAEEGDQVAKEILVNSGRELALMAKAVYEKIRVDSEEFIIGGVGSVFSSKILRESFIDNVKRYIPSSRVIEPLVKYMPIKGLLAILVEKTGLSRSLIELVVKSVQEEIGE
jgi:N-acetylglucosamine kinase-like BadF-type ATPase